jgi:hypothetical protein
LSIAADMMRPGQGAAGAIMAARYEAFGEIVETA